MPRGLALRWLLLAACIGVCTCEQLPCSRIPDAACGRDVVDAAVHVFARTLRDLQTRDYFRYFPVNLEAECPFWEDDFQCTIDSGLAGGCTICECEEGEVPDAFLKGESAHGWVSQSVSDTSAARTEKLSQLDRSVVEPSWVSHGEDHGPLTVVNLLKNPERFTGYSGEPARRVWSSIHDENCFGSGSADACFEKRVFYRLMSGLQSSITTHIAREYFYPSTSSFAPNVGLFLRAVAAHEERLDNLYFAFLVTLRAVTRARDALLEEDFGGGSAAEDAAARALVLRLTTSSLGAAAAPGDGAGDEEAAAEQCRRGFDESALFQVPGDDTYGGAGAQEKLELKEELRAKFLNVSRIMDCVGCEKCRLWGKLQVLGLGTAVRILLTPPEELSGALERREVVALVNTLAQLARSLEFAAEVAAGGGAAAPGAWLWEGRAWGPGDGGGPLWRAGCSAAGAVAALAVAVAGFRIVRKPRRRTGGGAAVATAAPVGG